VRSATWITNDSITLKSKLEIGVYNLTLLAETFFGLMSVSKLLSSAFSYLSGCYAMCHVFSCIITHPSLLMITNNLWSFSLFNSFGFYLVYYVLTWTEQNKRWKLEHQMTINLDSSPLLSDHAILKETKFWGSMNLTLERYCQCSPRTDTLTTSQIDSDFMFFFQLKKITVNVLIQTIQYPWLSICNSNMHHLLFSLKVNYVIFFLKHSFEVNTRYCIGYCLPNLGST